MTKTFADMTPEERDKCIGMWCDYDFPDGTTHRAILLSRGSSNTATVIDTTQCGVPQQWTRVDQLHPRFDLPRAFNPDGTPVHATRETQVGDDGLYLEANGTTFYTTPGTIYHRWVTDWEEVE